MCVTPLPPGQPGGLSTRTSELERHCCPYFFHTRMSFAGMRQSLKQAVQPLRNQARMQSTTASKVSDLCSLPWAFAISSVQIKQHRVIPALRAHKARLL